MEDKIKLDGKTFVLIPNTTTYEDCNICGIDYRINQKLCSLCGLTCKKNYFQEVKEEIMNNENINIELSRAEAMTVLAILRNIGGDIEKTLRKYSRAVSIRLESYLSKEDFSFVCDSENGLAKIISHAYTYENFVSMMEKHLNPNIITKVNVDAPSAENVEVIINGKAYKLQEK